MKNNTSNVTLAFLAIPIFISIYAYIFDLVANFSEAFREPEYLLLYISQYLVFRSWLFMIAFIPYNVIFSRFDKNKIILFKVLYICIFSLLYSAYFFPDDYSLSTGSVKQLRLFISCALGGTTVLCLWEYLIVKRDKHLSNR